MRQVWDCPQDGISLGNDLVDAGFQRRDLFSKLTAFGFSGLSFCLVGCLANRPADLSCLLVETVDFPLEPPPFGVQRGKLADFLKQALRHPAAATVFDDLVGVVGNPAAV